MRDLRAVGTSAAIVLVVLGVGLTGPSGAVTPTPGRLVVAEGAYGRPCNPPQIRSGAWLTLEPLFSGRGFRKPVQALAHPTRPGIWWIVESEGRVLEVRDDEEEARVVLDIRDRVRAGRQWGLQAIALSPEFPKDPRVFVTYTAPSPDAEMALESRVASFRRPAGSDVFDPASEIILVAEAQATVWHPIAGLRFGPDGMLYVGWGEGGSRARDRTFRGKILRVDVSADRGRYEIPEDNPFLDGPHRPEVFAAGFRNPWRFSFDPATGALWVADVGGRSFEEVSIVSAGEDHGWPQREGFACRARAGCNTTTTSPVLVHPSSSVCAVIGGHVYGGRLLPSLRGKYVYGDYCSRSLHAYDPATRTTALLQQLPMDFLVGIEVDGEGELYLVEAKGTEPGEIREEHRVYRLTANAEPPAAPNVSTHTITSLGCEGPEGPRSPPADMIPYEVVVPAWDEGAEAQRFVQRGFRSLERLDQILAGRPKVLLKTLFVEGAPVETQMLAVDRAGEWGAWSFAWDERGETAEIVTKPAVRELPNGRSWRFDTAPACFRCHSAAAGRTLGLSLRQVDTDLQLDRWFKEGIVRAKEPAEEYLRVSRRRRALVDPKDETASLDDRARSFLHVRCSPCHQPGGEGGPSPMDLSLDTPLERTGICEVAPIAEYPGLEADALVVPGRPDHSLVYLRAADSGSLAMPPNRLAADRAGANLLRDWIAGLGGCSDRAHSSSEK